MGAAVAQLLRILLLGFLSSMPEHCAEVSLKGSPLWCYRLFVICQESSWLFHILEESQADFLVLFFGIAQTKHMLVFEGRTYHMLMTEIAIM